MEDDETKPKVKPRKMVSVSVVSTVRSKVCLVEWTIQGRLFRGYLPVDAVVDNKASKDDLDAATPYGVPWGEARIGAVSADDIANALHRAGIWTVADLRKGQHVAVGALQSAYGVDLSALNKLAKEYETKEVA